MSLHILQSIQSLTSDFSTDYVLVQDKVFKKYAKAYAQDQDLFFKEYVSPSHPLNLPLPARSFSAAVAKLFELGVPTQQFVSAEPWIMPTVDEQKDAKSA